MELCNKKSNDGIWMDEVAAMQASHAEFSLLGTSGFLLAGEGNGQADTSASDSATSLGSLDTNLGRVQSSSSHSDSSAYFA